MSVWCVTVDVEPTQLEYARVHVCVCVCVCRWMADMKARETPECLGATARQAKTELRVQADWDPRGV